MSQTTSAFTGCVTTTAAQPQTVIGQRRSPGGSCRTPLVSLPVYELHSMGLAAVDRVVQDHVLLH